MEYLAFLTHQILFYAPGHIVKCDLFRQIYTLLIYRYQRTNTLSTELPLCDETNRNLSRFFMYDQQQHVLHKAGSFSRMLGLIFMQLAFSYFYAS